MTVSHKHGKTYLVHRADNKIIREAEFYQWWHFLGCTINNAEPIEPIEHGYRKK